MAAQIFTHGVLHVFGHFRGFIAQCVPATDLSPNSQSHVLGRPHWLALILIAGANSSLSEKECYSHKDFHSQLGPETGPSNTFQNDVLEREDVQKSYLRVSTIMDEKRTALLRTHQMNIARYQKLLKFNLNEAEVNFLERLLAEERFAVAMLGFMSPNAPSKGRDFGGALE
jgi:hypothetical protein